MSKITAVLADIATNSTVQHAIIIAAEQVVVDGFYGFIDRKLDQIADKEARRLIAQEKVQ